jgi:hypothetical protein
MHKSSIAYASMNRATVASHGSVGIVCISTSGTDNIDSTISVKIHRGNPSTGRLWQIKIPLLATGSNDGLRHRTLDPLQVDPRSVDHGLPLG